jgi:hypothetical protein
LHIVQRQCLSHDVPLIVLKPPFPSRHRVFHAAVQCAFALPDHFIWTRGQASRRYHARYTTRSRQPIT